MYLLRNCLRTRRLPRRSGRQFGMATVCVARYLPGIGVARLFLGQPVVISGGPLAQTGEMTAEFRPGQCLGAFWYWHEKNGRPMRMVAIGRCTEDGHGAIQLPGVRPDLELRVLVEQAGTMGGGGPADDYLPWLFAVLLLSSLLS